MESKANRRKLRNLFISKDLQRPMIIAHLAYLLFVFVAIIATVLSPYYYDIFATGDIWANHFSAKTFSVLLGRLSITSIFIAVISFFHFVIFTHKFCGPLVNIGHTIARISESDFSRTIYLRKGDFLKNEAKQINAMMNSLSNSIARIKKENHLLFEDIDECIQAHGKQSDIDAKLKDIQYRANRCRVQLDNFKLGDEAAIKVGLCQCRQVVSENPLSANKCL
ncbi:methyl-accepting chemotaxis protein [Desulfosarcina alkanivorans]|uniref:methyl-accepting chemotaxis protein n=1 Tax=Desulfosarcina alkanivorans TaxID=571177 RepID=UPI0012D34BED|nr:methyl-accepting chemotaxis protein [Desulfosarcina alkanivorans]